MDNLIQMDNLTSFSKKVVSKLEPLIHQTVREELDSFKDASFPIDTDLQRQLNSKSKGKKKLILVNPHSPGDVVMMTAAIRDLHATYPNEYKTDIDTACREIFEGNPNITRLDPTDTEVVRLDAQYPLIHESNEGSYHFIHGYRKHLEELIGRPIKQGKLKGDIYIREEEKSWIGVIEEITGDKRPYWIIDAGHKQDFTCKAWSFRRYQEVVSYFKDKIQFVQIGHKDHIHPELDGVINMVGQTDLRQLIRLFYWSIGVITPVSLPMTLAAAVPFPYNFPANRACIVIAGGREPVQWQHYPTHQFLHTVGTMPCCQNGGCWRSRTIALGDGDDKDINNKCLNPTRVPLMAKGEFQWIPRCMYEITTIDVIRAVERFYNPDVGIYKYHPSKTLTFKYDALKRGSKDATEPSKQESKTVKVIPDNGKPDLVKEVIKGRKNKKPIDFHP